MRPTRDQWAMELAVVTAKRATCLRRQVGAVLLNARGHVLATGYNGVAAGQPHCNEDGWSGYVVPADRYSKMTTTEAKLYITKAMERDSPHVVGKYDPATTKLQPCSSGDGRAALKLIFNFQPHACSAARAASGTQLDGCEAIHAEQNALLQCRDVYSIDSCYVTASPCMTCTKLLLNTACQHIFFLEEYPHNSAQELWERAGRTWTQLK